MYPRVKNCVMFVKMKFWFSLLCLAGLGQAASVAFAAADSQPMVFLSLPLNGYYRSGKYMPVRIEARVKVPANNGEDDQDLIAFTLHAPGAMKTALLLPDGHADGTAPWMVLDDRAQYLSWSAPYGLTGKLDVPLHPLGDNQRIVGFAISQQDLGQKLFPTSQIIPIALDSSNPLPGSIAAWDSLDAIVLDDGSARCVSEAQLAALLSCGVTVAVRGGKPPWPAAWPWKHLEQAWVLRPDLLGPATAWSENALQPANALDTAWPAVIRQRIVLFGAIAGIIMMAVLWFRPRHLVLWVFLAVGGSLGLLGCWWHWQGPVVQVGGGATIVGGDLIQEDDWLYQVSAGTINSDVRWLDVVRPIFTSRRQFDECRPSLVCFLNGDPRQLRYHLRPGQPVAILARGVGLSHPVSAASQPVTSPLEVVLKEAYLGSGDNILGQLPPSPKFSSGYFKIEYWPRVVIRRGTSTGGPDAKADMQGEAPRQ